MIKRELTVLHIFLLTTIVPVFSFMQLNSLLDTSKETSQAMKCQLKETPEAPSRGGSLQFLVSGVAKAEPGSTLQWARFPLPQYLSDRTSQGFFIAYI